MITVPEAFAQIKCQDEGERGRDWIAGLPGLVDELMQRWSCVPDGAVMHGRVGIVVPVRHRDLPPAVIKVSFPHPGNRHEPDAYALWEGRGAVHIHARDDDNFAMLLERASHRTLATVTDPEEAVAIQGGLSRRLAVPAPAGLPRLSEQTETWQHEITSTAKLFDNPFPRRVIDAAVTTLRELGPGQPALLVHGDLHDANILAAEREPWLAVDPKASVGDPAHNALNAIRSPRFGPLLHSLTLRRDVHRLLDIFCDAAELDPDRVRRWTQLGAVREAMWGRRHNDPTWLIHATDRLAEALT